MELTPSQTQLIRADLKRRGLHFPLLQEELLDHVCCLVEEEMAEATAFQKAYSRALKKLGPLHTIQSETLQAVESAGLLSRLLDYLGTACYLCLGLVFFAAPVLLSVYHQDGVFVLFFSPFVVAGFWLLATRIDYRRFAVVTFNTTLFPGSLVR